MFAGRVPDVVERGIFSLGMKLMGKESANQIDVFARGNAGKIAREVLKGLQG